MKSRNRRPIASIPFFSYHDHGLGRLSVWVVGWAMPNKRCFVRNHRVADELLIVKRNSSCANRYEKPSSFCCGRIAPAIYRRRPRLKLRKTWITKFPTGSCTYFLAESRIFSYCALDQQPVQFIVWFTSHQTMDYKSFCLTLLVILAAINTVINLRTHRKRWKLIPADQSRKRAIEGSHE